MTDDRYINEAVETFMNNVSRQWVGDPGNELPAAMRHAARNLILIERERCARIADDIDGEFSAWGDERTSEVAWRVCADIAAAIRGDA